MKRAAIVAGVAASIAFAPAAQAQVCEVMVIVSALVTSAVKKRELTQNEAFMCGLPILPEDDKSAGKTKKAKRPKKAATVEKAQ